MTNCKLQLVLPANPGVKDQHPQNKRRGKDRHTSTPLMLKMGYSSQAVGYQTL